MANDIELIPVTTASQVADVARMAHEVWNEYYVPFYSLQQRPWGVQRPFDAATILNLIWEAVVDGHQAACFDFWLDDVALYRD